MGFFKDVKQGVGLTIGYKATEGGLTLAGKAFRAVAGIAGLIVVSGGIRTCVTEPNVARDVILNKDGSTYVGKTLENSWDNAVLAFKGASYLLKVASDGKTSTYAMPDKPPDCKDRMEKIKKEGLDLDNEHHVKTLELC